MPIVSEHEQVPTQCQGDARFAKLASRYIGDALPAVWIAVYQRGNVVSLASAGWRNIETGDAAQISDEIGYGSITKSFTATMIATLVADGTLDYDKPVYEYLPDLASYFDGDKRKITLRFLVSHRAGFQHGTEYPHGTFTKGRLYRQAYVKAGLALPLKYTPGETTQYSNIGMDLAAEVAETVTKTSWENLIRERVAGPLHLESLRPYDEPNLSPVRSYEINSTSTGFSAIETNGRPTNPVHRFSPSAALRGTTTDLMNYGVRFLSDQSLNAFIGNPTIAKQLVQPPEGFAWTLASTHTDAVKFTGAKDRYPDAGLMVNGSNDIGSYRTFCRLGIYRRSETVIAVLTNCLSTQSDSLVTRLTRDAYQLVN